MELINARDGSWCYLDGAYRIWGLRDFYVAPRSWGIACDAVKIEITFYKGLI